jgi:hypothetical protein
MRDKTAWRLRSPNVGSNLSFGASSALPFTGNEALSNFTYKRLFLHPNKIIIVYFLWKLRCLHDTIYKKLLVNCLAV